MSRRACRAVTSAACTWRSLAGAAPLLLGGAAAFAGGRVVDLTHPFDAKTIYWPTSQPFRLEVVAKGESSGGYWYEANQFCAAEHGGTHVDAPCHFAEGRLTLDAIPLERLIGPAAVVDVRPACAADPDYRVRVADILEHEKQHGRLPEGAIVLFRTGWGERWPDRKRYLGDDRPGMTTELHFPGISAEAAKFLAAERQVRAVGLDTASLDHGPSRDFVAHQILNGADIPGLENVANLHLLPARGATVYAIPMKIAGGSGGPARIFAVLPEGEPRRGGGSR
jgi:kynurenine formamidase